MGSATYQPRRERGATLVEFAVVAPLLFLLLFGVIEFARVVSAYTTVWTGAREGARYATTSAESDITSQVPRFRDCAGIIDAVQAKAVTTQISPSDITIVWKDDSGTIVADCDDSSSTYPNPKSKSSGIWTVDLPQGSSISVEVQSEFEGVVPLVGQVLDGLALDSTQQRSIYEGIVGAD